MTTTSTTADIDPSVVVEKELQPLPPGVVSLGGSRRLAGGFEVETLRMRAIEAYDEALGSILSNEPFFAIVFSHIEKVYTHAVQTMAVAFEDGQVLLLISPQFVHDTLKAGPDGKHWLCSVFIHEGLHVSLDHLKERSWVDEMKSGALDHEAANCYHDLEINSVLVKEMKRRLPGCPYVPGLRLGMPADTKWPEYVDISARLNAVPDVDPVSLAIVAAPHKESAEVYRQLIEKVWKKRPKRPSSGAGGSGDGQIDPNFDPHLVDDHRFLRRLNKQESDQLRARMQQIHEEAAEKCNNSSLGWGTLPVRIQAEIMKSLIPSVDWREELRDWTGSQQSRQDKSSTFKRVNSRFPYIQPGKRRSRGLRLAAFCDQSGSVYDRMLELLCAEISGMTEVSEVTFIPFDSHIDHENIFVFERGSVPEIKRTAMGGTDFNAPTNWINSDEHRDEFDMCWILTDGCAPKPHECLVPRCWVLGPGCKLLWGNETESEKIVTLTDPEHNLTKKK